MASIKEKKKNNKIISYKFICYLGRDGKGNQIRRCTTWHAPEGLSPTKERKVAEKAADAWEEEVRKEYERDLQNPTRVASFSYILARSPTTPASCFALDSVRNLEE